MSIKKKNNIWHYDFTCNSKRYRGSTGQRLEKDARLFVRNEIAKLKGETSAASLAIKIKNDLGIKVLLDDAFNVFVKMPRRQMPDKKQISIYKAQWNDFTAFIKNKYPDINYLSEITPRHSREYIQHIRTKGRWQQTITYKRGHAIIVDEERKNSSLSTTTQNKYLNTCNLVFSTLLKDAPYADNPFLGIPKVLEKKSKREAFTVKELKQIGEKAKDKYFYPVFLIGISTGLRLGDICHLKWSVIDLQKGWINKLIMRKTGREVSLPILPGLLNYLSQLERDESKYVFSFLQEKYVRDSSAISKDIRNFLESINIKSSQKIDGRKLKASIKGAHSLRHTFAYLAGVHGIPLPIVQSILGHMSPEMTSMYSDHATAEAKQLHLAKLPDYLSLPVNESTNTDKQIDIIVKRLKKEPGLIDKVINYLEQI